MKLLKFADKRSILAMVCVALMSCMACESDDVSTNNGDTDSGNGGNLPDITDYPIVGTNQTDFFDNTSFITEPGVDEDFYGQNAFYLGNVPSYTDNGDGTVTDNVTGLMWQSSFDHNGDGEINVDDKLSYSEILELQGTVTTAGYTDWRIPTIKE